MLTLVYRERNRKEEQRFFQVPLSHSLMAAFLTSLCPVRADGGRLFHYGRWAGGSVCAGSNERRRRFPLLTSRRMGSNCSFADEGLGGFILRLQFSSQNRMLALAYRTCLNSVRSPT